MRSGRAATSNASRRSVRRGTRPECRHTPSTVSVRNLRKHYDGVRAVQGISFDVEPGEIFGLLGPNGAGKTTTIECVVGLRDADEGDITVCGLDARRHPRELKRKIGAALQSTALQDKITPREAIELFSALYQSSADPDRLLARFGLNEKADAAFDTLSGGQQQRLALALAFVNTPEVVVLDEPTAGLDTHVRRDLHAEIRRFKHDGVAVLLSTHDMDEAQQLCDRIAVMKRGHIAATGAPADLIASSRASHAVNVTTSLPVSQELLTALAGTHDLTIDGVHIRFRTSHPNRTIAALTLWLEAHGIEVGELHVQKATLEELFVELTS